MLSVTLYYDANPLYDIVRLGGHNILGSAQYGYHCTNTQRYPAVAIPKTRDNEIRHVFKPLRPTPKVENPLGELRNENSCTHANFKNGELWPARDLDLSRIYPLNGQMSLSAGVIQCYTLPTKRTACVVFRPGDTWTHTFVYGKDEIVYTHRFRCAYVTCAIPNTWAVKIEVPNSLHHHYVYVVAWQSDDTRIRYGIDQTPYDDDGSYFDNLDIVGSSDLTGDVPIVDVVPGTFSSLENAKIAATNLLYHALNDVGNYYPQNSIDVWGELATKCTGTYKHLHANVPATVIESTKVMSETMNLIQSVIDLRRRKPKRLMQALGNLRLSVKWGLPLTYRDLVSISQAMTYEATTGKFGPSDKRQIAHASMIVSSLGRGPFSGVNASRSYHLKTIVRDSQRSIEHPIVKWATDYNIIALENLWDFVPYSFVVDWLTDFGTIVSTTDNVLNRVAFMDIIGSVRGTRLSVLVSSHVIERLNPLLRGWIDLVQYDRWSSRTIPLPTLGYLQPSVGFTQWVDGMTLIGQQLDL